MQCRPAQSGLRALPLLVQLRDLAGGRFGQRAGHVPGVAIGLDWLMHDVCVDGRAPERTGADQAAVLLSGIRIPNAVLTLAIIVLLLLTTVPRRAMAAFRSPPAHCSAAC